jgi:hypothetical protein
LNPSSPFSQQHIHLLSSFIKKLSQQKKINNFSYNFCAFDDFCFVEKSEFMSLLLNWNEMSVEGWSKGQLGLSLDTCVLLALSFASCIHLSVKEQFFS